MHILISLVDVDNNGDAPTNPGASQVRKPSLLGRFWQGSSERLAMAQLKLRRRDAE